MIENLFLQCPFEESGLFTHEIVKATRNNIVVRIIDFIRMARADHKEQKSYSTTMLRINGSDTYKGYMFVFPLNKSHSILMSAISVL